MGCLHVGYNNSGINFYSSCYIDIQIISYYYTVYILFSFKKYSNIEIDKKNPPDPRLTMDLVWVSYIPYDVHTTNTIFVIHWILQWYASVIGVICYLAFDCFCVFLIFHLIGQLNILQEKIRNINTTNHKNKTSENLLSKLKYIVKRHQELIRFVNINLNKITNQIKCYEIYRFAAILEKCVNKVLLIQLLSSCLNFTVQGYLLLGVCHQ